jgi:hypothetical protein
MSEDPTPTDASPQEGADPTRNGNHTPDRNGSVADLWARVVELEREARFLSAKCNELRHSCRDLLAEVGSPGPLTEDQVRSVRSDAPRLSQDEVFAEYRRLREERAAGVPPVSPGTTAEQLSRRIADLQPAVAALTAQREALRPIFLTLAGEVMPLEPPTEEEIAEFWRLAQGPPGPSIGDIIAEFEREHRP